MIWKNILFICLSFFSVLGCGVCHSFLSSYLHTNLYSHFPVASIAAFFPSIKDKKIWVTFMKHKIFSRDILAFQLSFWRYLAVYKRTLFLTMHCWQNALTQLWLLKWFSVYYKKNFKVRLNYPIFFSVIPYRFDHLCRLSLKRQAWKRVVNVKEKYEI